MKPLSHLTLRVAWHDSNWNGKVCSQPSLNSFCVALPRIRENKPTNEHKRAGCGFDTLSPSELPPCKAESGFFMSPHSWIRELDHPYRENKNCAETHGNMVKRLLPVPAYSAIAVPFNWMLRRSQKQIDQKLLQPLPLDATPPFPTPWVFGSQRQEALTNLVFGRLTENKSLVLFYTKEGHPLGDSIRRLVVGIGCITKIGKCEHYDTINGKQGYPLWDRVIGHSIRPDGETGFLLPYQEYLAPTGNPKEDALRAELVQEIIVTPPSVHYQDFSYGAEVTDADVALSILTRALAAVRKIRDHGLVKGPWQKREEWLNKQIDLAWKDRGAFPGIGPMLEALGMRLGTALVLELRGGGIIKPESDPWPVLDEIFQGKRKAPHQAFEPDIQAVAPTWLGLPPERRQLLLLLSRFDFTPAQAKRVWEDSRRRAAFTRPTSDHDITANPYVIAERDLGGSDDSAVSLELLDHGLLPDESLAAAPKVSEPSRVDSASDRRRTRCALVTVLQQAAENGDTLLSQEEALGRLPALSSSHPILITTDWVEGNSLFLEGVISRLSVEVNGDPPRNVPALQLSDVKSREEKLAKILRARCAKP